MSIVQHNFTDSVANGAIVGFLVSAFLVMARLRSEDTAFLKVTDSL